VEVRDGRRVVIGSGQELIVVVVAHVTSLVGRAIAFCLLALSAVGRAPIMSQKCTVCSSRRAGPGFC